MTIKSSTKITHKMLLASLFLWHFAAAQSDTNRFTIAFYNVENLFDAYNDPLTNDDDFTPTGAYHWTNKKYQKKISNIAKVFLAMGKGEPPDIIGMAEIENSHVLRDFCKNSPLQKFGYQYIHYDSPDIRGIDVGLIYRKERVQITHSEPLRIVFPFDSISHNRDILYLIAQLSPTDSIHIFVNHWTSRYSGYAATIPKRNCYAQELRRKCNEIFATNAHAQILIMGDFNDYPTDESLEQILQAKKITETDKEQNLYNLMYRFANMSNIGSHKYEDFWGCLDQIIVSSALLKPNASMGIVNRQAEIFQEDFMLLPDEKFGGEKLFRTHLGYKYLGGYSDHLPVYLKIELKSEN